MMFVASFFCLEIPFCLLTIFILVRLVKPRDSMNALFLCMFKFFCCSYSEVNCSDSAGISNFRGYPQNAQNFACERPKGSKQFWHSYPVTICLPQACHTQYLWNVNKWTQQSSHTDSRTWRKARPNKAFVAKQVQSCKTTFQNYRKTFWKTEQSITNL